MKNKKGSGAVVARLLRTMREFYPVILPLTLVCIVINAVVSSIPSIFMQNIIAVIERSWQSGDWSAAKGEVIRLVATLAALYAVSLIAGLVFNQLMAIITQGTLKKLRCRMFDKMQCLPIKYFDTNSHGDIMSHYTNDIDTLRQMVSQSFPQLLSSTIMVTTVFCIMLYYSLWLTLVVLAGVILMLYLTGKIGGKSASFFFRQQTALGKVEGFAEEMMSGMKVVKVFCHEAESEADFDRINEELFRESEKANKYANTLGPILNNIGNVLYVIVAVAGGLFLIGGVPNVSISGLAFSISIVVPFLNMTKSFAGNIGQVSHQVNSVVMGIAGTKRIFALLDEEPEGDEGYVTLVNAKEVDGEYVECAERTGLWAWKHPHKADGTVTYVPLRGDVRLFDVDFEYEQADTARHLALRQAGPEGRLRRCYRRRQDHNNQPAQPLLRHSGRQNPLRRHQHQQNTQERPPPRSGHRASGY